MHVYYIHFKGFRVSFIGGIFCSLLVYNNTKSLSILCHPTEQLSKISPIGAWCAKSKLVKKRIYDNRSRWIEARESGGQVTDGSNWMQLIAVSTLFHTCCSLLHTTTKQKCTHSQHYAYCRCASRLSFHYISFSYIITCPPVAKRTLSAPQPMGYCIALNPLQPYYNATARSKPIFINYILCRPVQI